MENSRTIQSRETREKIYETSLKLFKKYGFNKVTIKDIATAADVSVGSYYNYFHSKQDILYNNFQMADERFKDFVAKGIPGKDVKEKIQEYMLFYIEFVLTHPFDFIKILYTTDNTLFIKKGRPMQTLLNPLLEEAKINGEFKNNLSVEEINEYLFLSMRGLIFHWCLNKGSFSLTDRARKYLSLIINSL